MKHVLMMIGFTAWLLSNAPLYPDGSPGKDGKSFLWKVEGNNSLCYLLGSVHVMKKEAYPLPQALEDAFKQSEKLALEADVSDEKMMEVSVLIMQKGMYPAEDSLEKNISPDTLDILKKKLEPLGLGFDFVNRMKPWMAAMTIVSLEMNKAGYDAGLGIDKYFAAKAKGKKEIVELEGFNFQINLFESFSKQENEKFLVYTLKEAENTSRELENIIAYWRSGDTKKMETVIAQNTNGDPGLLEIFRKINDNRNIGMAEKVVGYLASGKKHLVIAGAMHMVGPKGLVRLLQDKGYAVTQL